MTALPERIRGFTLIEIAIVLVVIGLLLSGGLLAIAPVLQSSRLTETNSKLDLLEDALLLYAIRNGCLPCPATGTLASDNANAGLAVDNTQGAYTINCATDACTNVPGVVPWRNLGISEEDIIDGFGYRISYAASDDLVETGDMVRSGTIWPQGDLTVQNTAGNAITPPAPDQAAYVLISHGPDHSFGFAAGSGVRAIDANGSADQTLNSNASPFVQDRPLDIEGANYFDDILRWRTGALIVQLCGVGECGN